MDEKTTMAIAMKLVLTLYQEEGVLNNETALIIIKEMLRIIKKGN